MVGIFSPQGPVGGIFNRINQAATTPAFGLGIGLLSGSPQAGFENAQNAIRTQQAGEVFDQRQEPQAVREARWLFPGDPKKQRAFVEKRTIGQAGGVQSTFTDAQGNLNLVMRDGSVVSTGKGVRNPLQIADVGGVPTGIDRLTGQAQAISSPEQVGGNAAQIAAIKAFGERTEAARAELPAVQAETSVALGTIDRLSEDGDLHQGFLDAFGVRRPGVAVLPGAQRRDAQARIANLVEKQVIEVIQKFPGAISEGETKIARDASTILGNPDISDKEATRALADLRKVFSDVQARAERLAAQSPLGALQSGPAQNIDPSNMTDEELAARIKELSGQ